MPRRAARRVPAPAGKGRARRALEEPGQVTRPSRAASPGRAGPGRGAPPSPRRAGAPGRRGRVAPLGRCRGDPAGVAPGRGRPPCLGLAFPARGAAAAGRPAPTRGAAAAVGAAEARGCRCRSSALIPGSRAPVAPGICEGGRAARGQRHWRLCGGAAGARRPQVSPRGRRSPGQRQRRRGRGGLGASRDSSGPACGGHGSGSRCPAAEPRSPSLRPRCCR